MLKLIWNAETQHFMHRKLVDLEPVSFLFSREILFLYNRVICKVTRLGGENAQFQHNKASNE
jgi:hypothetical protein